MLDCANQLLYIQRAVIPFTVLFCLSAIMACLFSHLVSTISLQSPLQMSYLQFLRQVEEGTGVCV